MGERTKNGPALWDNEDVWGERVAEMLEGVAGKAEMVTGTYVGDGKTERTIVLGFTPRAVILTDESSNMRDGSYTYGGVAVTGSGSDAMAVTEGGFLVRETGNIHCNYCKVTSTSMNTRAYRYIALA